MAAPNETAPPAWGTGEAAKQEHVCRALGTDCSSGAAAALAERGIPVFPCRADKRPLTANGFHDATTDADTIADWWRQHPDALVAVPTGKPSGLLALDMDPDGEQWAADHPEIVTAANRVHYTPRGMHYLFMYADGIRNSAGKVAPGVDIRGDGGYVIWWPAHGRESYGEIEEAGPVPDALTAQLRASQEPQERASTVADAIPEGQRDNALTSLAGTLRRKGLTAAEIAASLRIVNESRCQPPHDEADIQRIAHSVARYEAADPLATGHGEPAADLPTVELSDLATADVSPPRFVIDPILPVGVVTLLGAHGGTGKSMLGLILCVCAATGTPFLGHPMQRARVVFYSCEDNADVIRHRIKRICNALSIDPADLTDWLTVYDMTALDPALYCEGMEGGVRFGTTTRMYEALRARCHEVQAGLVIVDNASDAFEANENDRARVRGFMRSLSQLARELDAGAMLLAHLDKNTAKNSGAQPEGYSGSTAWHNSARSRLFLYAMGQALHLEHQKSNLGPKADTQYLYWQDGVLVPVKDTREKPGDSLLQAEQSRAILRLIHEFYERGEYIPTSHQAPGNAWKALSGERGFPKVDKQEFQAMIRDLERGSHIEREEYTNAQRKTRLRWRVTDSGLEYLGDAPSAPT